jgi:hypothetical protein
MSRPVVTPATRRRRLGLQAWLPIIAALGFASLILGSCSFVGQGCDSIVGHPACTHGPTHPPGGISQDAAIAAAVGLAPAASANPTVVWASVEHDPFVPRDTSAPRVVWEVRLQGSLAAAPCPSGLLDRPASSADKACVDGEGGLIVVLDYHTGAFVGWSH